MKTILKKSVLYFWLGFSLFLLLISFIIIYFSIKANDYPLMGVTVFTGGSSALIYFCILFDLYVIKIPFEEKSIQFIYPFSFKKTKKYLLNDLIGYYIFSDEASRRVVFVLNDKKEYHVIETYYENFKLWQDYIFENYKMISHKNYKVYNDERKANELTAYYSLFSFNEKFHFEQYTFKLYGLLAGAILGLVIGMYKYGFEINWFTIIACCLIIFLYVFIRNRKYVSTLEKEDFNKEKN